MLLCKNRRLFTVAGDNSHVLTPIPMHLIHSHSHPIPIPWLILLPFPCESHRTHGIPAFPIPMHTSTRDFIQLVLQPDLPSVLRHCWLGFGKSIRPVNPRIPRVDLGNLPSSHQGRINHTSVYERAGTSPHSTRLWLVFVLS